MNLLNGFLTFSTEVLFTPLSHWPLVTLLLWSAITGILMTWVFRYASNQRALGTVVDRISGHLLAIKLFKDDLPGMFRSLGAILGYVAARLWYSLSPILVMLVPLLLLLCQLALRYEHRPLQPGESTIVQLQLSPEAWLSFQRARLEVDNVSVETAPLRDESQHSVYWRIKPNTPERSLLRWQVGTTTVEKNLIAREDPNTLCQVSRRRPGPNLWDRTLNPGEPGFGKLSPIQAITIGYPARETPVLGFNVPWWLTFFVVSVVVALLMQPVLHVRF